MKETLKRQQTIIPVDLSLHPCPACGRSDRWEGMHAEESAHNNPTLIVWCDCGQGELQIIIE
jgi:hypothetical protein